MYPVPQRALLRISWVLRVGAVMEFIGHGALGLGRVAQWTSYFGVVGIGREAALGLMPLVGAFDVALALTVLLYPVRAVIVYMAAWGLWTAVLRPLAGESTWEAVERAGNFGALAALYLMAKPGPRSWIRFDLIDGGEPQMLARFGWVLRMTTVLLLVGHGALSIALGKPVHGSDFGMVGLHGSWVQPVVGMLECLFGIWVLVRPGTGLLLFVVVWKLATEVLAPMAGAPLWVFIEHGGSYAAPLALAFLLQRRAETARVPVFSPTA